MTENKKPEPEPEFRGPFWLHPYFVYCILTLGILGGIVFMAVLAIDGGWIPKRM